MGPRMGRTVLMATNTEAVAVAVAHQPHAPGRVHVGQP